MNKNDLIEEINFGIQNSEKIFISIIKTSQMDIDRDVKTRALAYDCLGYYNAIEHLMIRILKYLQIAIPSGPSSHRDILRSFEVLIRNNGVNVDENLIKVVENLMAFRHVATKIYGFLLDWNKLQFIVRDIEENHNSIKHLMLEVLNTIRE